MGEVRRIADRYLHELATLEPTVATYLGLPEGADRLPDLSPDGAAALAELATRSLRDAAATSDEDVADRRCRALLTDRLGLALAEFDSGEHLRPLGVLAGAAAGLRQVFDLMPTDTDDDWATFTRRVGALPAALAGLRDSLQEGIRRGVLAAPRQALGTAGQLSAWAGATGTPSTFAPYVERAPRGLQPELSRAAQTAAAACAELAGWLRDTYAPAAAHVPDAVGRDAYVVKARQFLGMDVDPDDAYAWAWEELARIEAEMADVASVVVPGASIAETLGWLDAHGEVVEGEAALLAFLQELLDTTVAALDGTHFDLPDRVRRVEAMIAPPGGAAAQYYTPPSADFSRPGRTWYPTMGKTRFPLWGEVSTCYHEGVPGHHLQLAQWVHLADQMSLFQGVYVVSGNVEGWALYAERLMDELGFLEDPGRRLGYLVAQQLRATRVIVDIGMHLALALPAGQPFHPGEPMTPGLGREFLGLHGGKDAGFLDSEWERYLGWPGQAICYKLGERVWLAGRDAARRRAAAQGRPFDLKAWHTAALAMGSTGLDHLAAELPAL